MLFGGFTPLTLQSSLSNFLRVVRDSPLATGCRTAGDAFTVCDGLIDGADVLLLTAIMTGGASFTFKIRYALQN